MCFSATLRQGLDTGRHRRGLDAAATAALVPACAINIGDDTMRTGRQLIAMRLLAGSAAILMHPDAALAQQEVSPAAQEDVSQDIVVTGVRGAQQKAINVKRDAAQIVDSIAAEDIGKLPDARA